MKKLTLALLFFIPASFALIAEPGSLQLKEILYDAQPLPPDKLDYDALNEADRNGKLYELVTGMIKDRSDIEKLSPEYQCGLFIYCSNSGDTELMSDLVAAGFDVNLRNSSGMNALHYPAWRGNFPLVKLLVGHGIDVNAVYNANGGLTPLCCAAEYGDLEIFKYLVEHGADIYYENEQSGASPIRSAAYHGNYDIFLYLVERMPEDFDWQLLFSQTIIGGDIDLVRYMVEQKGADVNFKEAVWGYPMHLAASQRFSRGNNIMVLEYLLEQGGRLDTVNDGLIFPWALEECSQDVVMFFIYNGVEPSNAFKTFPSSLSDALDNSWFDYAGYLLQYQTDFEAWGMPLVLYFADGLYNSSEVIFFLIRNGINTEHYPEALFRSAASNDLESVALLLEFEVDVNFEQDGVNALGATRDIEVARLLIENGIDTDNTFLRENLWQNFAAMQAMVEAGIDLGMSQEQLNKALNLAAKEGNASVARFLLSQGANPDSFAPSPTSDYYDKEIVEISPLMVNAMWGYEHCSYADKVFISSEVAALLLAGGADVNLADANGMTALHYAAGSHYCRIGISPIPMGNRRERSMGAHADPASPPAQLKDLIIETLIESGADVNARDYQGRTPLMIAVSFWNDSAMELLMEAGADPGIKDNDKKTAFDYITSHEVLKVFIENGYRNKITRQVLNRNMENLMRGSYGNNSWTKIRETIEWGADINYTFEYSGSTLLNQILNNIWRGWFNNGQNREILSYLLENGADINRSNDNGYTPLINAVNSTDPQPELVEFLILNGAKLDARDKYGRTPLIHAVERGYGDVVEVLLGHGADVNLRSGDSVTALTVATLKDFPEIQEILRRAGAERRANEEWWYAVNNSHHENAFPLMDRLLEEGLDINMVSTFVLSKNWTSELPKGITALMYFAKSKRPDGVRFMLDRGADVNFRNKEGRTALWYAKRVIGYTLNPEITEMLENAGAEE